jgi:hypothetical protein
MTPEESASHAEQLAADYRKRAGESEGMIILHPNATTQHEKWRRGVKRDLREAARHEKRALNIRARMEVAQ